MQTFCHSFHRKLKPLLQAEEDLIPTEGISTHILTMYTIISPFVVKGLAER